VNIRFRRFHGPSLRADHAVIAVEFDRPLTATLPAETIASRWLQVDSKPLWVNPPPASSLSLAELVATIAVELQHPQDRENARVEILAHPEDGGPCVALGYLDARASMEVLRSAVAVSLAIFQARDDLASLAPPLGQVREMLQVWLPQNPLMRTLIREARVLGIPVYPTARNSRIWLFGQGARGVHFHQAATDGDSFTGMRMAMHKEWSNQMVIALGFPGMTHAVANDVSQATKIARKLGYPVVVKPVLGGQGKGVSAYILDDQELAEAYAIAASYSSNGVIVERYVAGDDHRLAVFGGQLTWVASRRPAQVIGDGRRTVAELITAENERRRLDPETEAFGLKMIQIDQDVVSHLRKQGLSLDSCPAQGVSVILNSVSNIARGGTLVDLTDRVHPDNRDMAESIARAFRMTSVGIDFQTPDISRSWRDLPCGVIEVNGTPGIIFDERAQRVLRAKFPGGSDGRIPSVLLIHPPAGLRSLLADAIAETGVRVGETDDKTTHLAGMPRCRSQDDLLARLMALIADPGCEVVVIEASAQALEDAGLLLDRFHLAISFVGLKDDLRRLVASCCGRFIESGLPPHPQEALRRLLDSQLLHTLGLDPGSSESER
jgi:cyanophycin synthetase